MSEPTLDEMLAAFDAAEPAEIVRGPRSITVRYKRETEGWHVTSPDVTGFDVKGTAGARLSHAREAAMRALRAWLDPAVTVQEHVSDFICRCGAEQAARADALMAQVRDRLAAGSEELAPRPVTDAAFINMIVQSLSWDYRASISGIDNDQWSLIAADSYDKALHVSIQCDTVEDGFAAVWIVFAEMADAGGH